MRAAGDWGSGLGELHVYYWDETITVRTMRQRVDLHWRINLMTFFYICGTTSSNRACAWRHGECTGLLCCGKYQCKFMVAPRSSPIAASVTTKIKHVARFVRQWSRSPAAETAARWRCGLLIKFQTPLYDSQFCVSFHFAIDHETLRRL